MKVSINWLKEYVDFDLGEKPLEELFSEMGFPVEEIIEFGDDQVFDLEITPNRPDCLSHYGIAREMAAFLDLNLKEPEFPLKEENKDAEFDVKIEDQELCPKYVARILEDVEVKDSPEWLKNKLKKMGVQSKNSVVDFSNYILFAFGHPTHVFDMDKLQGGLRIRKGKGEKILCLDEELREVTQDDLIIADLRAPVAIAGVIGGEESSVTFSTRKVLIESAYFNPQSIRKTSKRLGISTEASYRFERGADPEVPERIADVLASLISKYSGAKVLRGRIMKGELKEKREISTSREFIEKSLGANLEQEFFKSKLSKIGCKVEKEGKILRIKPPSWRRDLEIPEDIVEEIARLKGYGVFPSILPSIAQPQGLTTPIRDFRWSLRNLLSSLWYMEAMTYVFVSDEKDKFSGGEGNPLRLMNPLNKKEPLLRRSLILTLLDSVSLNLRMGNKGAALFELGKVYWEENGESREEEKLALIETGILLDKGWSREEPLLASFYSLKGTIEWLYSYFGVSLKFREGLHPLFEDGYALNFGNGWMGLVKRELLDIYRIDEEVFAAEIPIKALLNGKVASFRDFLKFPSVKRDVSLLFSLSTKYSEIERKISSLGIPILHSFFLVDLYRGKGIAHNKKSLTFSFVFRTEEKTLKSEEVEKALEDIVRTLEREFGAIRRRND